MSSKKNPKADNKDQRTAIYREQGQRLMIFRKKHLRITQRVLASRLGISTYKPICTMERGTTRIHPEMAKLIEHEFGVSQNWLLTGEGPMMATTTQSVQDQEAAPVSASDAKRDLPPNVLGFATVSKKNHVETQHGRQEKQVPSGAMSPAEPAALSADMVVGVKLLLKIYESGSQTLIRAIDSNLHAFGEAIDNKDLARTASAEAAEVKKMFLENKNETESRLRKLELENVALKKRLDGDGRGAAEG